MESRVGDQRVCGNTIEHYCLHTQKNFGLDLTDNEKAAIVERRMEDLNRREWQRWVPVINFYRILGDVARNDNDLLIEMHSGKYSLINTLWAVSSTIASIALPISYILRN